MEKIKPKRPLAVNLIIAWLIFLPIINISSTAFLSTYQETLIDETETLRPNEYVYTSIIFKEETTVLVKLSSLNEKRLDLYVTDDKEFNKLISGEEWVYYSPGSKLDIQNVEYKLRFPKGEWFFIIYNENEDTDANFRFEVIYDSEIQNDPATVVGSKSPLVVPVTYIPSTETYTPTFSGVFGLIGIILYFLAIRSLWRMEKSWLWWVYVILVGGILFNGLSFYWWGFTFLYWIDWFVVGASIVNVLCLYWLFKNRNLFVEPPKPKPKTKEEKRKEKGEWKKTGLILVGLLIFYPIFFSLNSNPDYIFYSLLFIPIWIIFIWFILPKLVKWI